MLNLQEQENLDYEAGCLTELQNALILSRQETQLVDPLIRELLSFGLVVVVLHGDAFCPRTDATMGEYQSVAQAFVDEAPARAYAREEADRNPEAYLTVRVS